LHAGLSVFSVSREQWTSDRTQGLKLQPASI